MFHSTCLSDLTVVHQVYAGWRGFKVAGLVRPDFNVRGRCNGLSGAHEFQHIACIPLGSNFKIFCHHLYFSYVVNLLRSTVHRTPGVQLFAGKQQ